MKGFSGFALLKNRLAVHLAVRRERLIIAAHGLRAALRPIPVRGQRPVVFFNASTRISSNSQNAAYSLLTAWAVRREGVPVIHWVCKSGMTCCVMGSSPEDASQPMPCRLCLKQSRVNYFGSRVRWFTYEQDERLAEALRNLPLDSLMDVVWDHLPLGEIVLPSIRWRLRVHNLVDDELTRNLYREFILSAWNVAREFKTLLDSLHPQACVLFNGQFFPEAVVRLLCLERGIRVVTHEVGMQPLTAFFTDGEATAYPIRIPDAFELSPEQDARLDSYLAQRFEGNFSMAGIEFWPEMKRLDPAFLEKLAGFKFLVPVFTNVIFDTSQPHANTLFPDMFTWLDLALEKARQHPETLFVIRAHPDEGRPGKASRESVAGWVKKTGAGSMPNVLFVPADEYISSYDLIRRSKFVLVYNSTIGLEASIMGAAVLSAGRSRYTQVPAVFFPDSRQSYEEQLEVFLAAKKVEPLPEHRRHARRFMYYQLFRSSLPFDDFIQPSGQRGYVQVLPFHAGSLSLATSRTIRAVLNGILSGGDFLVED